MLATVFVAWTPIFGAGLLQAQTAAKPPAKLSAKSAPKPAIDVPRIPYTRFVLKNGLVVLLHEDHSSPIVAIDLTYHVGSKDELSGKRGFAHLFEHAMFDGSAHVEPGEHNRVIQSGGGVTQGQTLEDRTVFTDRAPANMLETVLWLEAERMAFLPARLDSQRFEIQRASVLNEYGRRFDGGPVSGFLAAEAFVGAMFPDPHPYHSTPFGVMSELKTTTIEDLRAFFDKYYAPNNATLAIAGDFRTRDAKKLAEQYFGGIPRRTAVKHPVMPAAPPTTETRIVLEDQHGNTQQLWLGWRGASATSPDRVALTALSAILSGGPTSRLYRKLVGERKLAAALPPTSNSHFDLENAGFLQIVIVPVPAASMTAIERVVDSVVSEIRDTGVRPDELRRWLATYSVSSVTSSQSDAAKARLLEEGESIYRSPAAVFKDIDEARRLTPADIQRVARKYIATPRVVMSIVPAGKLELVSKPAESFTNVTRRKTP